MKRILIEQMGGQTRLALIEQGELIEFALEMEDDVQTVGSIFAGRVDKILPAMSAVFVNLGLDKNAYLHMDDIRMGEGDAKGLRQGQMVLVQAARDSGGDKGARVTMDIAIPGRNLVLMPRNRQVAVSKKIADLDMRKRLEQMAGRLRDEHGYGMIIRTLALQAGLPAIAEEYQALSRIWDQICQKQKGLTVPACVHQEGGLIERAARDLLDEHTDSVEVLGSQAYDNAVRLAQVMNPHLAGRITRFEGYSLMDFYNLQTQIERAMSRKVWLRSGGFMIIDHTEAMTVIDVNTGKFTGKKGAHQEDTLLRTNIEAAHEIAKQLRLRDIGGIIIVDFIDMETPESRQKLLDTLQGAMASDRIRTRIASMTSLGLVEITRKRTRTNAANRLRERCPCCQGMGAVRAAADIVYQVCLQAAKAFMHNGYDAVDIRVHPEVALAISRLSNGICPDMPQKGVYVYSQKGYKHDEIKIEPAVWISGGTEVLQGP